MPIARYVGEIEIQDPDTHGAVVLEIYKHEAGGMLAIDASYVLDILDGDPIPDPFSDTEHPTLLFLVED